MRPHRDHRPRPRRRRGPARGADREHRGRRPARALSVDRAPAQALAGLEADAAGTTLSAHVRDVAAELPALLQRAAAAGLEVRDVAVRSPSLHAVFIHLTGRELRE